MKAKILIVGGENTKGSYPYPTHVIKNAEAISYQESSQVLAYLKNPSIKIVVIADSLPAEKGFDLLEQIKRLDPRMDVILCLTTYSTDLATRAIKLGAHALPHPIDLDKFRSDHLVRSMFLKNLDRIGEMADLRQKTYQQEMQTLKCYEFEGMFGRNPMMLEIFSMIRRLAPHYSSALITGETGTGKEKVARAFHNLSPRCENPFVVCNCAALVESLLESELFGHTQGAFTGALQTKRGFFELADGGTIFLDEVGELPQPMQSKLLRILETHEFQRVGSPHTIHVDIRVIAATNRDLLKAVADGAFRKDLFHRINMVEIHLPPLRDRKDDIPSLVRLFIEKAAHRLEKNVKGVSRDGHLLLMRYDWPGNIRELENVIERAMMMTDKEFVGVSDLPVHIQGDCTAHTPLLISSDESDGDLSLKELEKRHIEKVLKKTGGNKVQSGKILGLSRSTLYRKLEQFGLLRED